MAQQSARRGRKNQCFPPCHEHAFGEVVPVRELPYGPAAHRCIKGRTDAASDYAPEFPDTACNRRGVHRWKADIRASIIQPANTNPMMTPAPITDVSSSMAHLVEHRGWSLLHSSVNSGIACQASIQKNGVVLGYVWWKGEADYSVGLASPVHPDVDPELYHSPGLFAVLEGIGAGLPNTCEVFVVADINLSALRSYLSDYAIWERGLEAAIASMNDKYCRWINGPEMTRKLAQSLAERHPWLATGRIPTPATSE